MCFCPHFAKVHNDRITFLFMNRINIITVGQECSDIITLWYSGVHPADIFSNVALAYLCGSSRTHLLILRMSFIFLF